MTDEAEPKAETPEEEPQLDPYKIEAARSSRSRCRTCRRKIDKGVLRIGVLLVGPYGTGYLWHHLNCAAKRQADDVEEAYAQEAWEPGLEVPPLEELKVLREKAEEKKKNKKLAPYVELAPTDRSKCKHCEEPIAKGDLRVALLREVQFGNQTRSTIVNVHAKCASAELRAEDCITEVDGFADTLRANSVGVEEEVVDRALATIGDLG